MPEVTSGDGLALVSGPVPSLAWWVGVWFEVLTAAFRCAGGGTLLIRAARRAFCLCVVHVVFFVVVSSKK